MTATVEFLMDSAAVYTEDASFDRGELQYTQNEKPCEYRKRGVVGERTAREAS